MEVSEDIGNGIDIYSYIDRYEGYTKLVRLGFIIENCPLVREEALRILLEALKAGQNVAFYRKIFKTLGLENAPDLPAELMFDEDWVQTTEKNLAAKLEVLAADLLSAKNSMVKESIRMGHNDLGHLNYQIGNLNEALRCYLRTRDYNTMPRHQCEMCLNVISVSVDLNQYFNVSNFVNRLSDSGVTDSETTGPGGAAAVQGKMKAASGLVALHDLQFAQAARLFLDVNPQLENKFNRTISAEDIGVYGALTALATLKRSDLKSYLFDNKAFISTYLDLNPQFKKLVLHFKAGEYGTVLLLLNEVSARLKMDIHVGQHADRLLAMVSDRCILQYFTPYCAVDLQRMAQHMQLSEAELEQRLVSLIGSGSMSARIDSKSRTLLKNAQDAEKLAVQKALMLSAVHARAMRRDILRLSMMRQGFSVEIQMAGSLGTAGGLVMAGKRGRKGQVLNAMTGMNSKAMSIMGTSSRNDRGDYVEGEDDNEDDYEERVGMHGLMDGEDDLDDYEISSGTGSLAFFEQNTSVGREGAVLPSEIHLQQEMDVDNEMVEAPVYHISDPNTEADV